MNDKTDTQELQRNTNRSSKLATGGSILIILILVLILPALNFFSSLRVERGIRNVAGILQQQSSQSSPPPTQSFVPWAHEKAPVGCVILSEDGRAKQLSCFPLPNNEKSNWIMLGATAPSVAPSATPAPKR